MPIQEAFAKERTIPFIETTGFTWTDHTWDEAHIPKARILGTLNIGRTLHHITGIQVTDDEKGFQVAFDPAHQVELDALHEASGSDGRFEAVTIDGREYALFMAPYCD